MPTSSFNATACNIKTYTLDLWCGLKEYKILGKKNEYKDNTRTEKSLYTRNDTVYQ